MKYINKWDLFKNSMQMLKYHLQNIYLLPYCYLTSHIKSFILFKVSIFERDVHKIIAKNIINLR